MPISPENLSQIQNDLSALLKVKFPDASLIITAVEAFDSDGEMELEVRADRSDFFAIQDYCYSNAFYKEKQKWETDGRYISIRMKENTPKLVDAKVGDFVLIYSDRMPQSDDESHVGIVNSIRRKGKKKFYGCRYIELLINDSISSSVDRIEITEEDYGGYHAGFLRILTPDEVKAILLKRIDEEYKEARKKLKDQEKEAREDVEKLVTILAEKSYVDKVEVLQVNRDDRYVPEIPSNMSMKDRFQ